MNGLVNLIAAYLELLFSPPEVGCFLYQANYMKKKKKTEICVVAAVVSL